MKGLLPALLVGGSLLAAYPAYAAPSFCTGTTDVVTSGSNVMGSFLLTGTGSSGNCVEAGDKVFGNFSVNGSITGAGSSVFSFSMTPGSVTIGFQGVVGASTTGEVDYTVAVDPTVAKGFLIDSLEKDMTLNAINAGLASAELKGTSTATAAAWDCTRTVNPTGGTCPETLSFATVSQMTVTQSVTSAANTTVTGLTDTIGQVPPSVPEPASLAVLGSGLLMLGVVGRRRRMW